VVRAALARERARRIHADRDFGYGRERSHERVRLVSQIRSEPDKETLP
jgi:hypothetical protein